MKRLASIIVLLVLVFANLYAAIGARLYHGANTGLAWD